MIKQFNIFMTKRRGITMFSMFPSKLHRIIIFWLVDWIPRQPVNEYGYNSRWMGKKMWHFKLPQATTVLHREIDRR